MNYVFIGLGNPGEEYKNTRHNTGRIMLEYFRVAHNFPEWKGDKKSQALISKGKIGPHTITLVAPETFMNKSGLSIKHFIDTNKTARKSINKSAERMLVVYDDLDLPFGSAKISYNKSSGGHKGLESIIKAVKTQAFPRLRIGISPTTPKGKIKKPLGEEAVEKKILGEFKSDELTALKKLSKRTNEALEIFVREGREPAMTAFN